jgi:eukaryotic-like serine/threonine-protein kinase
LGRKFWFTKLLLGMADYIIRRMRTVLRLLWMGSVLIIVALLSALTAMRFAVHGREVTVPDFTGKSPSEARRMADALELEAQVEREYYSSTVAEGRVLSQMPEPGTVVRRGWEVRLALSLGPQRVAIPQVVGESDRAAAINIAHRGLDLGETAELQLPDSVSGQVVGQDPPANATDAAAPKINLLVAQQPAPQSFVMPNFLGYPLGSVTLSLKDAGFSLGKVNIAQPPAASIPANFAPVTQSGMPAQNAVPQPTAMTPSPASIVISQDPAAGAQVAAGATINLVVR